jgi:PPOX class probable F420-dependent enzyme
MDSFGLAHRIARHQDRLLYRVVRDRHTADAAEMAATAATFDALTDAEYALVVTFRRSGQPMATPMWFALQDGVVYLESLADADKVKRLRHDPNVRVAPCTLRGRPKGPFTAGVGRILSVAEEPNAEASLDRHYGRRRRYVRLGARLGVKTVYLELTPAA